MNIKIATLKIIILMTFVSSSVFAMEMAKNTTKTDDWNNFKQWNENIMLIDYLSLEKDVKDYLKQIFFVTIDLSNLKVRLETVLLNGIDSTYIIIGNQISYLKGSSISKATYCGKEIAVKKYPIDNQKDAALFRGEVKDLIKLCDHHVAKIQGFTCEYNKKNFFMVMNFYPHNLKSFLRNPNNEVSWESKSKIALGIAKGLQFLHGKSINHKRLRSENVLLDEDMNPKLIGFGFSRLRKERVSVLLFRSKEGTNRWRASEVFKLRYTPAPSADIYSFGMIMWELIERKDPFAEIKNELDVIKLIENGRFETIPEGVPDFWRDIILSCWKPASDRPTATEIIELFLPANP